MAKHLCPFKPLCQNDIAITPYRQGNKQNCFGFRPHPYSPMPSSDTRIAQCPALIAKTKYVFSPDILRAARLSSHFQPGKAKEYFKVILCRQNHHCHMGILYPTLYTIGWSERGRLKNENEMRTFLSMRCNFTAQFKKNVQFCKTCVWRMRVKVLFFLLGP